MWRVLLVWCALSWCAAAEAEVQVVAVPPAADSYIGEDVPTQDPTANTNFGTAAELRLRGGGRQRALLRFEGFEPTLPPGGFAQLISASVEMTVVLQSWPNLFEGGELSLHRVLEPWTESGVTWNCADDPFGGTFPSFPGCFPMTWGGGNFEAGATDTFLLNILASTVEFDVTSEIEAFLAGEPNDGWLVRLVDESSLGDQVRLASRESGDAVPPSLTVVYEVFVDTKPPVVTLIDPTPGGFDIRGPRPELTFEVGDAGTGLDSDLLVELDGVDITAECAASPPAEPAAGASDPGAPDLAGGAGGVSPTAGTSVYVCVPPSDLIAGPHTLDISVSDLAGNTTALSGTFVTLLTPGPHVVDLEAIADTTVLSDAVDKNRGTEATLEVQRQPARRALVDFDRAALADLAGRTQLVIDDATLELWVEATNSFPGPLTVAPFRLLESWKELYATWSCAVAAPKGECPRPWIGGNLAAIAESSVVVTSGTTGPISWTVTNDLATSLDPAVDPPFVLFGWALRFDPETSVSRPVVPPALVLSSRDSGTSPTPRLSVTFSIPDIDDFVPPEVVFLQPGATTTDATPTVELSFDDGDSGVDPSTFAIEVGGVDFTTSCTVQATGAVCTSPALEVGDNTYTATLADLAGNVAVSVHEVELLAGAPPQIQITQPPPAVLNQEVVAIAASFSDADGDFDPASARVILDGAHLTAGCTVDASQALCTSPLLAAGSHRLVVVARDLAGNESAAEQLFELTFDGTFPEIAIVAPATWFVLDERPDIEVAYSGTDLDTATFALRIDGIDRTAECDAGPSSASCEPGTALAEGLHRVEAEIANTAGNVRTAFVDFDLLPGDGSYVRTLNAVADSSIGKTSRGLATTLEVSSSPVNHGLVRFDTELFGPLAPWIQLDAIGLRLMVADQEGLPFEGRIFQVYGLDRDWNEVAATFECPADDDPGLPGTQCTEPWNGAVAGPALDTATIDPSNVTAEFDLTAPGLDPEGWLVLDAGAASPIPVRVGMAAREHGALNPPQLIVDFTLTGTPDFEPPTLAVVAPVGVVINEPMPDVELTYSDLESGIDPSSLAVSVGGVDISSGCAERGQGQVTCPVPFALTAGFHAVDAQVSDNAGNPAAAGVEFELVLDAAPPTILRLAPPEVVYNQPQPTIEVSYSDDSSVETATLEMDVDGIDLLPGCTVSATGAVCTPPALAAGPHAVRAYIEDRIGQPTEELFDFEIVDDAAGPTLAITSPTGTIYNDTTPAVTVTFSDAPAGVDPATLVVEVDGGSITASCSVDLVAGTALCESGELTAGPHTISVSLSDLAGNPASANGGFDLVLDADAPSLDVTGPTGTVEADPTPEIGLAFSDAVSGIDAGSLVVRVDGLDISAACVVAAGTAACEPPALGEGDHTVTAEIADLAGNVATDSQTFTVDLDLTDTTPPSLAITGPAGPVVDDPAPAITVTYSDAETEVDLTSLRIAVDGHELVTRDRCAVAGATATCIPPSLGTGTHDLTAEIRDLAGNPALTSSSFDLSFTGSDTVDPLVDITEPASSPVFDDLTPQIRVEYGDADSGVAVLTLAVDVDGIDLSAGCTVEDAFAVCEPPPLTVGSHVTTATVEDLHGNLGTATLVFEIDLTTPDTTPPVIAIAEPSATPLDVDVTPIRVTYADGETGIDLSSLNIVLDTVDLTVTCDLGPTEATCTSPVMAEGAHLLEASVQDLAGNPASASFPFEVVLIQDPDPPTLTWIEPIGVVLDDPTPTVTVDYADPISGVDTSTLRVWVDSFELTGCTVGAASATCEPPPLGNGEHIGRAEVRDLAGNPATVQRSFFVQLDLADEDPPSVAVTSPSSPIVVDDSSPEIRVVYSDAESGVDLTSVLVLVDGIALVEECAVGAAEAVCEPPDLAQGPHEIEGRVADLAANQATTTFAFEIQLTDPETDPPLLDVLSPTGTVVDETNPQVLLQFSDAGSGIALSSLAVEVDGIPVTSACQVDAASAVCPSPTLAAGSHQVDARISDLAGNETTDQSTFTVVLTGGDVTPPSVTVESPASVVTLETARFTVRYDDAESGVSLAGVSLSLDGVPLDSGCSIGLDRAFCDLVLTEGPHTASASVPDLEGNTTTVDHPFTVDLTPPDTVPPNMAVLEPETVVVDDPQPGIRVEYSDAGSGLDTGTVQVLLDGLDITGGCTVGSAEATCTPAALGAGSHLVQASVEDLEGNLGSGSLTFELILTPPDLVAPAVTIVAPSAATVPEAVPVSLELTYSDDASGIDPASLSVVVDGGDVSSSCQRNAAEAICPLGVLALGPHTVDVQIADVAGNPGTAAGGFEVVPETGPPVLDIVTPVEEVVRGDATPEIRIEYSDAVSGVDIGSLAATLEGVDLLPGCVVEAASAVCEPQPLAPGFYRVVAQISDLRGNVATSSLSFEVSLELEIAILVPEPGHLTTDEVIEISGTVSPEADSVTIEGVAAVLADGTFTAADIPLHEGSNTLTAIARTAGGGIGSATIGVVRDTTAPAVVIQAPDDGFVTTSSQILVTGEYNEPASSGSDVRVAAVTVNGVPAPVEQRTFALMNHLLQPGLNTIRVEATDAAGNVGSSEITVTLLTNPAQKIEELLGNGQSGIVGHTLANPLLVRVTDGIGNPLSERLVEFEVTRGDGIVGSGGESGRSLSVRTDPLGRAQVDFTLGERSGMGNHEVTVTSAGFPGSLIFCASGEPMPADRVVRVQGNVQTGTLVGVVGAELPKPLFAQVFDAMKNPVEGAEVTFEVVTGGGSFDGQPTETVETDARGVATAIFTLGPLPGVDVHVVKATIPQGSNPVASFNITGLEPGEESMTSVSGLVLDNQDDPVPLVTVSIAHTALSAVTDAEGRFRIDGAPVGTIHLVADGTTTPLPGSWPVLEFEMVTVSGQDNDLGMPIRLLPMADGVMVGGPTDVVIPLAGVPGASLTVYANSVTFPDGSREGLVSFTQVHNDKVPMVPPLGSVFAVALTIQPPGAHFDPPAQIQIPNPGHRPGEVVDIFSFDHDIGEFVPGGTGSVTLDGLYLRSNPGFGVRKGGWHGCAQPIPDTDACNPGSCTFCTTDGPQPDCEECEICTADGCETPTLEEITAVASIAGGGGGSLVAGSRVGSIAAAAAPAEDELIAGKGQSVTLSIRNLIGRCSGTLTYTWDPKDGTGEIVGQSVTHVYEDEGTYNAQVVAKCENCPEAGSASDSVTIKVIRMDLRLFNLPEENEPEPNEIEPGGVVALNNDDDDEDGMIDLMDSQVFGDDDLQVLRLDVDNSLDEGKVTLDLEEGADKMKVWEDRAKMTEVELPKEWELENEDVPGIVWIEGVERSESEADITYLLRYENDDGGEVEDRVNVTVLEVDLDIDSDNNNGFDPPAGSPAEDEIEDVGNDPAVAGKYVFVNHDDDDQDTVTDFADGFNLDNTAGNDDDANPDERFVPLKLKLLEPIDVSDVTIRLTYDDSNPAAVTVVPVPQIPATITVPDYRKPGGPPPLTAGSLRLWTAEATARTSAMDVKSGGQFVPSGTYTASELGIGGDGKLDLWVEALEVSGDIADQRILVEVDPDGESGPRDFMLQDAVRVTAVSLEVRDTAATPSLIEGGDMAFISAEPRMPQLTARVLPANLPGIPIVSCFTEFEYDRTTPAGDGRNCPSGPDLTRLPLAPVLQMMAPGETWNIAGDIAALPAADSFFGGDGWVTCTVASNELRHEFRIRGRNPDDATARAFVEMTVDRWWAYATAKHESGIPGGFAGEYYHQFDLRETAHMGEDFLYAPILGQPNGWGMMQIDLASPACIPISQMWNWQENVRGSVAKFVEKDNIAQAWLDSLNPRLNHPVSPTGCEFNPAGDAFPHGQRPQSQITNYQAIHPGTAVGAIYGTNPAPCVRASTGHWRVGVPAATAIPPHTNENCDFSETPGAADGSFEDAVAIKCYNGCNHYVVWDGATGAWDFRDHNDYVRDVCREVDP